MSAEIISLGGFQTPEDDAAQRKVAARVAEKWRCQFHFFGDFNHIDCYASRGRRLVLLAEIKCRTHARDAHPTVFLSMRKHLALTLGSALYCVPSVFIAGFTDMIGWIPIGEVEPKDRIIIGGHAAPRVKNDIEPLIEVPIWLLRWITLS